ncbi:protein tramtrack, beta isoform-like isoform X2 [Phymastichus coffea]|nr:protein tramtrack, beta isoform-like isoform X2 [Phymastichus coffea]
MTNSSQHYCLRWNNHMTNFTTAIAQLLKSEAFTDVTIAVDEGNTIKCHKMILAACSSYFQDLFMKNPCEHPIVILSDVKYSEIQAILDYMYRGEVNVAQDQLTGLLKVANFLKVKGLVEESEPTCKTEAPEGLYSPLSELAQASAAVAAGQAGSNLRSGYTSPLPQVATPYSIPFIKSPGNVALWPGLAGLHQVPQHPISGHQPPPRGSSLLGTTYESSNDVPPLSRKKLSSYMATRDTPILRNVLGGQSEGLPDRPDTFSSHSNSSLPDNERRNSSDRLDPPTADEDDKPTSPPKLKEPKPEWKRYKQYTVQHILDAMSAVSNDEMSALQASTKFGIPSRTLYDKLKKAGILPKRITRARRESMPASSARFPYSSSLNGSVYGPGTTSAAGGSANNASETESDPGTGYASEAHQATGAVTPGSLARTPSSRASLDEMDAPTGNVAATPNSNVDGAEDLSVGSRRSSGQSMILPSVAALEIKQEDEPSMQQDQS